MSRADDLSRIEHALKLAAGVLENFTPGAVAAKTKTGDDPVTAADLALNEVLHQALPQPGEGWLSEETADDTSRLGRGRVWVVDPLDGTREFVKGIPEWCVSVAVVEDGMAVAGGILSPGPGHLILGAAGEGVTLNGVPAACTTTSSLSGALVLASRSEVKRGEWDRFFGTDISVRNMGSVAYKLGLVGAGLADATWTLVPKHEWDVAAGAAIVLAGGGTLLTLDGEEPVFNQENPKLTGFIATAPGLAAPVREFLGLALPPTATPSARSSPSPGEAETEVHPTT
ncbi:MAG TPA: 3'(2'),5'-bisphosphate nucleotidase CysQ [Acidimicrobiia bacterium]|nr:3'(2'),5'-bisphosphate nucleotidase CysQ [Acidimicrobiia bacterium]